MFNSIALLIPAYNPEAALIDLLQQLVSSGFGRIVLVDDGSEHTEVLDRAEKELPVHVLRHPQNCGKGAALKTGFTYIAENFANDIDTIITADADGQHLYSDVVRLAEAALNTPSSLILGVRDFQDSVPLRSKFGNYLTRTVLQRAKNISLSDTQTGLRAIPLSFAVSCCELTANRYEFELETIVLASKQGVPIEELPITTVYIDNNDSSHFRPIVDSMRVYAVFARFISVSFASFLIDISAFAIAYAISANVYTSTFMARSLSSTLNFLANKFFVFRSHNKMRTIFEASGYVLLVVVMATLSAYFVNLVHNTTAVNVITAKIVVDGALFVASFLTQKFLLFRRR
ncbi:Undecaprenyl-phosphate 4-deoxy-4-formamido-L-arabinose transferase [Halioglobus japonicus]|nr:Undecaprenyl-phosphate 4-deoxy-4-formamido-L-arabinose transferase [Halioglobus japonicus]